MKVFQFLAWIAIINENRKEVDAVEHVQIQKCSGQVTVLNDRLNASSLLNRLLFLLFMFFPRW